MIYVLLAASLIAGAGCAKEDMSLAVDFNHSYRIYPDTSFEALVVPLVLNSAQIGASGIYIGTDSLNLLTTGSKIPSSVSGSASFSILIDTLIPTQTYYWLPYIEADWMEYRGDILSF